ncbi:MAG: DNA-3-methyladenine glycosylase I [Sphaerochaetaceae bacterium]|nr:DNA-3-methyladenine glycosylase I [Sphaerochaetaceae bacterium]
MTRCPWCLDDELYMEYHDEVWGTPLHDDKMLFEFLVLEGAQAGLSWITILKRREEYRKAFEDYDIEKIASWGEADIERLLGNSGIIRNRRKIESAINNARATCLVQKEFGSLDNFLWSFVDYKPIQNHFTKMEELPASNTISESMSKELKKRGFSFVGPTICYAFMQATGMVNDHLTDCFRYHELI